MRAFFSIICFFAPPIMREVFNSKQKMKMQRFLRIDKSYQQHRSPLSKDKLDIQLISTVFLIAKLGLFRTGFT